MDALSPIGNLAISGNTIVEFGDQLQLICSANDTGPGNTVMWRRRQQQLVTETGLAISTDDDNSKPSSISILTITSIDAQAAGPYECSVSNDAGSDESTVTVIGESFLCRKKNYLNSEGINIRGSLFNILFSL